MGSLEFSGRLSRLSKRFPRQAGALFGPDHHDAVVKSQNSWSLGTMNAVSTIPIDGAIRRGRRQTAIH